MVLLFYDIGQLVYVMPYFPHKPLLKHYTEELKGLDWIAQMENVPLDFPPNECFKKQSKLLVRASSVTNVTMEMILSYLGSHAYIMDAAAAPLEYYTKS